MHRALRRRPSRRRRAAVSSRCTANAKYPCGFDFAYTVTREGQDVLDGSSSGSGGPSGVVEGNSTGCAGPGTYTLRARYVMSGPYWTDTQINSGYRTYNLDLPCG